METTKNLTLPEDTLSEETAPAEEVLPEEETPALPEPSIPEEEPVPEEEGSAPEEEPAPEEAPEVLVIPDGRGEETLMRTADADARWTALTGDVKRRRVLSGIVSSVEHVDGHDWVVTVDYYGIRVLIPLREMVLTEWPEHTDPVWSVISRVRRMLGATVDFVPLNVRTREHTVIASRREAMLIRQKQYYATGRIQTGTCVQCRVIGVSDNGVSLEAAGVDSNVRSRCVSQDWFSSAMDLYSVGETVPARVMDLHYDPVKERYSVTLSIRDAQKKDDRETLRRLSRGSMYFGTVTGVRNGNIYVRLQAGCNAATRIYRGQNMPERNDTVSFEVRRIDEESQMVFGVITRIIHRHPTLR